MSSFLMGCYDPDSKKWCTVTKCSGGYDDAMLARLQKELDVVKISKVGEESATKHTHTRSHTNKILNCLFLRAGAEQNPKLDENCQELLPRFHYP